MVKEAIFNSDLRFDCCATVFDCYMKMKSDIGRNGQEKKTFKLLEYKMNPDSRMLKNLNLIYCKTHIGFGTDDLDEYTALIQNNNNIVYTDRGNRDDMNLENQTLKTSQVHGELLPINNREEATWKLTSSFLS